MTPSLRLTVAAAVLGSGLFLTPAFQDARENKTEDLAAEVQALKEQAKKHEDRLAIVEKKAKDAEDALKKIQTWIEAIPAACTALDEKMNSARANGFEKAGPNPDAKRDVLDGLKNFAKALGAKTAPPAEDEEK